MAHNHPDHFIWGAAAKAVGIRQEDRKVKVPSALLPRSSLVAIPVFRVPPPMVKPQPSSCWSLARVTNQAMLLSRLLGWRVRNSSLRDLIRTMGRVPRSVPDSGDGIPDHLCDRVLEPFFTTKPIGEGTGLGLSITHSIARKHGGSLQLTARAEGGTLAVIRFPLGPNAD